MKYDNPEHESFTNVNILNPDTEVPFHDEQTISISEHFEDKLVSPQATTNEASPFPFVSK